MSLLAILAFAAGLVLGLFWGPLSVMAGAGALALAVLLGGSEWGVSPLWGAVVAVVLVNLGYLAGALVARQGPERNGQDG
ncbi:MAG: hypothetical protein DI629_20415 [Mesorhizobium amorphae]|nr:MAG: hypothetical protein DI629_20415 [Mesorhizobium amorphae]